MLTRNGEEVGEGVCRTAEVCGRPLETGAVHTQGPSKWSGKGRYCAEHGHAEAGGGGAAAHLHAQRFVSENVDGSVAHRFVPMLGDWPRLTSIIPNLSVL